MTRHTHPVESLLREREPPVCDDPAAFEDLWPGTLVWQTGTAISKTVHRRPDCRKLQQAATSQSIHVGDLTYTHDLCRGDECWPKPNPTDQGMTCPYCGEDCPKLPVHLPCPESEPTPTPTVGADQ